MLDIFYHNLKEKFKNELPGVKAQTKMAPSVRTLFKTNIESRKAAVLILIFPKGKDLYIAFIKRTKYNGPHSGQISFPGGKVEDIDRNYIETALRESKEEIGINPQKVKICGQLTPLHIPVSNFIVYPIVGIYNKTPLFKAEENEVEEIIEIKLRDLYDSRNCSFKEFHYRDISFSAPIYNPLNITIWGATAMILSEFLEVVDD